MRTLRFGLKKLDEQTSVGIFLKSKFGLKPVKGVVTQEEKIVQEEGIWIIVGCNRYGNTKISQRKAIDGSLFSISELMNNWYSYGIAADAEFVYFVDTFGNEFPPGMYKINRADYSIVATNRPDQWIDAMEYYGLAIDDDNLYSLTPGGSNYYLQKFSKELAMAEQLNIPASLVVDNNCLVSLGDFVYAFETDVNNTKIYRYKKSPLSFDNVFEVNADIYSFATDGKYIWARGIDNDGNRIFKIDTATMTIIQKGFNSNIQTADPWRYIAADENYIYFVDSSFNGLARTDMATLTEETNLCSFGGNTCWLDGIFALRVAKVGESIGEEVCEGGGGGD